MCEILTVEGVESVWSLKPTNANRISDPGLHKYILIDYKSICSTVHLALKREHSNTLFIVKFRYKKKSQI